jgi:phytoene synthase
MPDLPPLPHLNHCRHQLQQHDRDRYVLSLYLPSPLRELCWVLGAFNVEVARTAEAVSEAMIGQIRLKWWLEVLEQAQENGPAKQHPVAESVTSIIRHYQLPAEPLVRAIEAREVDLTSAVIFENIRALDHYATDTGGLWMPLAALAEKEDQEKVQNFLQKLGYHWALLGLIRATGYHLHQQRSAIPAQVLLAHQLEPEDLFENADADLLHHLVETLTKRQAQGIASLKEDVAPLPKGFRHFRAGVVLCDYYYGQLLKEPEMALRLKQDENRLPLKIHWHLLRTTLFS